MDSETASTPILFIIFNRPDLTAQTFDAIRRHRPGRLFIAADGPRDEQAGEADVCQRARAITEAVDWPCEVTRFYSDRNLGCGRRVSSAISQAFRSTEELVILEDDCLPAPTFFDFCDAMLCQYRDDDRVMCVAGDNFQKGRSRNSGSYYFSKYPHCWGWATWRNAWRHYDFGIADWPILRNSGLLESACPDESEAAYWRDVFDRLHANEIDTWDFQWMLACWRQNGLTVLPDVNLISNIGFDSRATHTTGASECAAMETGSWTMRRPTEGVFVDRRADRFTDRNHFSGRTKPATIPLQRLSRRFSRLLGRRAA